MKKMTYNEIRQAYLDHMIEKGHAEIPSASLVPENDPTVLFVNAGMFPLVPFLVGETHPKGTRITNSQRSLRTIDIESVGDATHLTTFEMLGNWSLNDYFKNEAIRFTVDFFVNKLGYDINHIYASVFRGNDNAPKDEVSISVWKEIFSEYGIDAKVGLRERIQEFDQTENWWELGSGGPCGPDSEIFYDMGLPFCSEECNVNCSCGKFVEVGNNVFMEYLKDGNDYSPLGRNNVDFGGGLARLTMISQGVDSVYETDKYKPIFDYVKSIGKNNLVQSERIITDHIIAATWIIMDGVLPGRTEREYILRRLIRRAIRHGRHLGIDGLFIANVADVATEQFKDIWSRLETDKDRILSILTEEEEKFSRTIENGLKEFDKVISSKVDSSDNSFNNDCGVTFMMHETYGFPLEMSLEELQTRGINFNEELVRSEHEKAFKTHQEKSRSASKGFFKGGLADTSEQSKKLHTATHLLLRALYDIVGDHIYQKGSNITPERLRLDFPNDTKLSDEQLREVEALVNNQITNALPISYVEMKKEAAINTVRYAAFEEKYSDTVKVYYIGEGENAFSIEICNGPHVENTSELGKFRITKQENVGSGTKRIKAVLE